MSIDGLAYSIQGRTGRFGQVDSLSLSTLGKIPKITAFIIGLKLGVTINIDSEVLKVFDVESNVTRDFLIIARDEAGTSLFAKELGSEIMRTMGLESEVIRTVDIESIVEVVDTGATFEMEIESTVIRAFIIDSEIA